MEMLRLYIQEPMIWIYAMWLLVCGGLCVHTAMKPARWKWAVLVTAELIGIVSALLQVILISWLDVLPGAGTIREDVLTFAIIGFAAVIIVSMALDQRVDNRKA